MTSAHSNLSSKERWFLAVLVACALVLRVIYISEVRSTPFFEHPRLDALFHDTWARAIASGEVVGDKIFFRAPAYPYFLGTLYAMFGHNYLVPRIVQHILGTLGLVILYLLARRIFNIPVALLASTLALLYSTILYFEGELLFDSLLAVACILWLSLVERAKERTSSLQWVIVGFVYGVLCCIRPPFLAIAPFIFAALVWRFSRSGERSKSVKTALSIVLGCLLPILPITIRNYMVGHDIVLIAYQGGVNFYIGNNPEADGYSSMMPGPRGASWENRDQTYIVEKTLGHVPSPSEESRFWYARGLRFVVEQPVQYISLLLKKVYLFWNWYEIPNNQNFYTFRKYSVTLQILPIGFWIVGPLGLLGMILAIQNRHGRFAILFILLYSSVTVLFFVCDRFRLPIVPLLCIFAAYGAFSIFEVMQRREWKRLSSVGMIGAACTIFVNSNLCDITKDTSSRDLLSLGIVEINRGNFINAVNSFEQAAEGNILPPPNLYLNWGVAEWRMGHTEAAKARFHQEIIHYPDSYGAFSNLSFLHLSQGRADSAIYFGTIAIQRKPYLPKAYLAVARAFQKQGELAKAVAVLEQGLHATGDNLGDGGILLASLYRELGRLNEAESLYRHMMTRSVNPQQPAYEPDLNFTAGDLAEEYSSRLQVESIYGLGHIWAARQNLDSAIVYFQKAVFMSPEYTDAWADLGVALMQSRRFTDADSALTRAIGLQPRNHLYWYNYGTLLGSLGRLSEAENAFEQALNIKPDFEPAREKVMLIQKLLKKEGRSP